jgi:hypothetical protein
VQLEAKIGSAAFFSTVSTDSTTPLIRQFPPLRFNYSPLSAVRLPDRFRDSFSVQQAIPPVAS